MVKSGLMKRIPQLDGIRALAFLLIFVRHAFDVPLLWTGVDVFFVLSGFLITSLLLEARGKMGAWSHFYERRALRILPPLALTLILATYFARLHWGLNILWYVFFAMNFAEAFHHAQPALGILWSLAVEEQFYLFWPIVALNFLPLTVRSVAIILVVLAPVLRGLATPLFPDHWAIFYLMPFRMDLLASGAILATLWTVRGSLRNWRRIGAAMMIGGATVFVLLVRLFPSFEAKYNTTLYNVLGYSLVCCMASGLIAYTLGVESGWWLWLMSSRPARWLGMISYTAYLVHAGAIALVQPFGSRMADSLAALAITIGYAALSWYLVEQPILRLRPSAWIRSRNRQGSLGATE